MLDTGGLNVSEEGLKNPRFREFKARQMARLIQLEKELAEKYPDSEERVKYLVEVLMHKLYGLRVYTLNDYIHTLYLAGKEFKEFSVMIPKPEEVDELLGLE
jgi:hypothetical protein